MYTDHFLTRKKRVEYFVYQRFWDKFYDAKVSSYYFQFYAISARRKKRLYLQFAFYRLRGYCGTGDVGQGTVLCPTFFLTNTSV